MFRASMTLPQGSKAFLGGILKLIRGLKKPHHRRRLTDHVRNDIRRLVKLLLDNGGSGYFDISHLPWFPAIWTDAMKDRSSAGWGWCCANGLYDYGEYDRKQRKENIDALEGDAVYRATSTLGDQMRGHRVPLYIDNSAFQLSMSKGWSRAERLTEVIKRLHELSVQHDCYFIPIWISTHDNIGADALSRLDLKRFDEWASTNISGPLRRA